MSTLELQKREEMPVALTGHGSVQMVAGLLKGVIDRGITSENVEAVDKLVGLLERMDEKEAERQFCQAFTALQSEMPRIEATKGVPAKDGTIKYRYAPIDDIMLKLQPHLTKHGFAIRFSEKPIVDGRVTMICTLMHKGGHSISNEYSNRIGAGPPLANESQADGSAASYAQRGALCDCLNIVTFRVDDDARSVGAPITKEQAESLRKRVKDTGSDEKAFLDFAKAKSYEEIGTSDYARLDASLRRKERT